MSNEPQAMTIAPADLSQYPTDELVIRDVRNHEPSVINLVSMMLGAMDAKRYALALALHYIHRSQYPDYPAMITGDTSPHEDAAQALLA